MRVETDLERALHGLAEGLAAPSTTLAGVRQRARRRRRATRAAGATAVVAAVLAAIPLAASLVNNSSPLIEDPADMAGPTGEVEPADGSATGSVEEEVPATEGPARSPTESTRALTPDPATSTAPGPTGPAHEATSPSTPEGARELGQDEDARIGQAYLYRLYTHCGIVATWWNGAWWDAAPPLGEGGSAPHGWNDPFQDGIMVQVSEHQLEFTGDEGQEAAFVPRPPEHGAPPPCD